MEAIKADKIIEAMDKADAFVIANLKGLAKECIEYKTVKEKYAGPLILKLREILSDVTTTHQVSLADAMISMACVKIVAESPA